jgi:DNA adenine methylase
MLKHILSLIPPHSVYVEVFGGSGKVLLNKPRSKVEVWNDYDRRIANLFYVVAFKFEEFNRKVRALVYSLELFKKFLTELEEVKKIELGDVDSAAKVYYVLCCMFGGGSVGLCKSAFKFHKFRNFAEEYWKGLDKLWYIRERLSNVIIESDDFEKIIKRWDSVETFFYMDPPYYGAEGYYSGFSKDDHERLLRLLKEVKGKWLLSGYANELYDRELEGFNRYEFRATKFSYYKKGLTERPRVVEVLWCNYEVMKKLF